MVERGTGRRAQILAVAAELFAKHGYHGVSIADLGAAVGVSGPALYRHFEGKDALLAEMLISISEHLLTGGQELTFSFDPPTFLGRFIQLPPQDFEVGGRGHPVLSEQTVPTEQPRRHSLGASSAPYFGKRFGHGIGYQVCAYAYVQYPRCQRLKNGRTLATLPLVVAQHGQPALRDLLRAIHRDLL